MRYLIALLGSLALTAQAGLPPPVQPAFLVTLQTTSDTVATVEATWRRPGTPGSWALRYPWRSDASYVLEGVTQNWQTADTAATEVATFPAPRFWEDVTANFCVRSVYQDRSSGERCATYVIPARPLPPPDSLQIHVTLAHSGYDSSSGAYFVTLRWDSLPGTDFFGSRSFNRARSSQRVL